MPTEEWRTIDGSKGRYEVSNLGHVRRMPYGNRKLRVLRGTNDGKGYFRVLIAAHGTKRRLWHVSHLVALAFHGQRPNECEINHIDSNPSNNRADNLEWVTHLENMRHSWRTNNRQPPSQGTASHFAKLADDDVREIRQMRNHGHTYASIAEHFNTKPANVWHICIGRTWKHLLHQ